MITERDVYVYQLEGLTYPAQSPFHPSTNYPEYTGTTSDSKNLVYEALRECFRLAGLDCAHYGEAEWNPLGDFIRPGETVLLKPNLVKESHPRDPHGWQYVLTHGSVIRAVADYVAIALKRAGKIILADAPQTDSSFAKIVQVLGLKEIASHFKDQGIDFEIIDLRLEEWTNVGGVITERTKLRGDPQGGVAYNLGKASEFFGHSGEGNYYGADYDEGEVNRHHSGNQHEYLIAKSAIEADVFINLPKLKTHKKAGITVNLKNLVGINANKNWLPHHTEGTRKSGGDERPSEGFMRAIERKGAKLARTLSLKVPLFGSMLHRFMRQVGSQVFGDTEDVIRSGNWYGNDTVWRMCLDLNKCLFYGNPDGSLRKGELVNRKRYLSIVDGIIAGEGSGPMNPDPVQTGLLLLGLNPCAVDTACAWLMGFDPEKIPIVRESFITKEYRLVDFDWQSVELISNRDRLSGQVIEIKDKDCFWFKPHFGWVGVIERKSASL